MYLEGTCGTFSADECERLYRKAKPLNYKWLVNKIKRELPDLYERLSLNLFNPWWEECFKTKTHYILVWSAQDYFIRKE